MKTMIISLAASLALVQCTDTIPEEVDNWVPDQYCYEHLNKLDGSFKSTSVISNCEPYSYEGEQMYRVNLAYSEPYWNDPECTKQQVLVAGKHLEQNQQAEGLDTWLYDTNSNEIVFNFKHKDMDWMYGQADQPKYNCQKFERPDAFLWVCPVELVISHQGYEQFIFRFQMKVVLYRAVADVLNVSIVPNVVIGDCCENELKIDSQLALCEDEYCAGYKLEHTIQRQQIFYVEHQIMSKEFQHYHLILASCQLQGIQPDIIHVNESYPGKCIITLASQIAFHSMNLNVISQVQETSGRRFLAESQIKDDYKLNGDMTLNIQDDAGETQEVENDNKDPHGFSTEVKGKQNNNAEKSEKIEESSDLSIGQIFGIAVAGTFVILFICFLSGFVIYKKLVKKQNKNNVKEEVKSEATSQKYQVKDEVNSDTQCQLPIKTKSVSLVIQ